MKTYMRKNAVMRGMAWLLAASLTPALAQAHVGVGQTSGFAHGLGHPFMGLDHLVAMVAVGLWAAQRGGRALWAVPMMFVVAMSVGGLLGILGVTIPFVEPAIAASVLVLGMLIAAAVRLPLLASIPLVGLFAIFHGHAHGMEMPGTASGLAYGVGFLSSTILLHGCGIGFGLLVQRLGSPRLIRYAGAATVALGLYLCMT